MALQERRVRGGVAQQRPGIKAQRSVWLRIHMRCRAVREGVAIDARQREREQRSGCDRHGRRKMMKIEKIEKKKFGSRVARPHK